MKELRELNNTMTLETEVHHSYRPDVIYQGVQLCSTFTLCEDSINTGNPVTSTITVSALTDLVYRSLLSKHCRCYTLFYKNVVFRPRLNILIFLPTLR